MKSKLFKAVCAAALCTGAYAQEVEVEEAEKGEFGVSDIVSAEFSVGFDSRFMTYGVVDGKDPILIPGATATFFDWFYVGVESVFDLTKGNGKGFGYGNRAGKYTLIDGFVGLAHEFDLGETIGTLGVDVGYMYEYVHRYSDEDGDYMDDTQYVTLEMTLGGHWLEPTLYVERDIMADDGTYANLSLGHTFEITEDFTVCPSIAQGVGNTKRAWGYFSDVIDGFDHGGFMDTSLRVDFEYALTDWLSLGAYVAYYDYLLDANMREAARAYNAQWGGGEDKSWNFVGGLSLTASF